MWSIIFFLLLGFLCPGHSAPLSSQNPDADGKPSASSVSILQPPAGQLNWPKELTITCIMEVFYPSELFLKSLRNGEPVSESGYHTGPPNLQSNTPKRFLRLSISKQEVNLNNEEEYYCQMDNEALPSDVIQKTIKKNTGK